MSSSLGTASDEEHPVATDTTGASMQDQDKAASSATNTSLKLECITDGFNERGIPTAKFVDDIAAFAESFTPPASPELLIGAYSDLFAKFKSYEESLSEKRLRFQQKIPEIEKSLALVKHLKAKQEAGQAAITRYNLADTLYAKAELDCNGSVNLWLGANVMLEYSYDEAIELLSTKEKSAKEEYQNVLDDLTFTRNQIITSEVNISRIYNWDVRTKRAKRVMTG